MTQRIEGLAMPVPECTTANVGQNKAHFFNGNVSRSSIKDCAHDRLRLTTEPYKDECQVECIDCFAQGPKAASNERFARRGFWLANQPLSIEASVALYWPVRVAV